MNNGIFNKEEIEILKRVIKDYNEIKKEIDTRIKRGYNFDNLVDYIRHLSSCNITNLENNNIEKYVDFNYCDICVSIYDYNNSLFLGDTIEVWNDKDCYYIGTFNNIDEIKKIIKEVE